MTDTEKLQNTWSESFYATIVDQRLFLTPLGTIHRRYPLDIFGHKTAAYCDVYIFGFRIARFAR
ncbi:MAG: hypothetical protein ACYSWO_27610 [Planctomycetota bacterium]|jgi:hypothetical protein